MQSPSTAELLLRIAAMSGPITSPQLPVATGARAEKRAATGSTKKAAIKRSKPVAQGAGGLQWMDAPSTVTNDAQMEALTNPAAMASAARTAAGFQTQSASPAVGIARDGGGEKENAPPQGAAVTAQPARRVHRKRPADLPNLPLAWEDTGSGLRPQSIVVDPGRRKGESPLIRFRLTPKREIYGKEMCQRLNLYKINKPGTAAPTSPAAGIYPPPPCPPPPPPHHTHTAGTPQPAHLITTHPHRCRL